MPATTIFVLQLLTATYTAGTESRSRQQRNDRLNAAKVSNIVILSLIWATAAISAVYTRITYDVWWAGGKGIQEKIRSSKLLFSTCEARSQSKSADNGMTEPSDLETKRRDKIINGKMMIILTLCYAISFIQVFQCISMNINISFLTVCELFLEGSNFEAPFSVPLLDIACEIDI